MFDDVVVGSYGAFIGILSLIIVVIFYRLYKKEAVLTAKNLRLVLKITFSYMAVSALLFIISMPFIFCLRLIFCAILVYFYINNLKNITTGVIDDDCEYRLRVDIIALFICLLTLSYASIFWGQNFVEDWSKHRSVLLDLYANQLNPHLGYFTLPYGYSPQDFHLVYYYALYLPGVYVVRIFNIFLHITDVKIIAHALSFSFFAWNIAGIILASILIPVVCKKLFDVKKGITVGYGYLTILIFSGLDYWNEVVNGGIFNVGHTEWTTSYFAAVESFICNWQWAPHHLVSGLLGVIILCVYRRNLSRFPFTLWSVFLISSSVFCWLGVLPFTLFFLLEWFFSKKGINPIDYFRGIFAEVLAAILLTLPIILFYSSRLYTDALSVNRSLFHSYGFLGYFELLVIEGLPIGLIIAIGRYRKKHLPWILQLALSILVLLPLFELGFYNDLVLRGSIPSLIVVMAYCFFVTEETIVYGPLEARILLGVFFIICIPAFVNEYIAGLSANSSLILLSGEISKQ